MQKINHMCYVRWSCYAGYNMFQRDAKDEVKERCSYEVGRAVERLGNIVKDNVNV